MTPIGPILKMAAAGAGGSLSSLAIVITLGLLALAPLGAAEAGVTAGFLGVTVSAGVFALASRCVLPVAGPTSALTVIAASLVTTLAQSPALPADPVRAVAAVMAALGAAVVLMGLLQVGLALLRAGRIARLVPQPVLAGFMNGVALLIFVSQLPALLALPPGFWAEEGLAALGSAQPGALLLGLATTALCLLLATWRPRWPAALLALFVAVVVWQLASRLAPGLALGSTLAPLAAPTSWSGPAAGLFTADALVLLVDRPGVVILGGVVLGVVGALEGLMNLRALDLQLHSRHDENRELMALGLANVAGGAIGALPMTMLRARAAAIVQAGGRGRSAAWGAVAMSALVLFGAGGALAWLPKAALAGLMLVVAWSLVDRWSPLLMRQWRHPGRRAAVAPALATMAAVALITALLGPGAGVGAGLVLSTLLFLRRLRHHSVRWTGTARARPSRRVYPPLLEAALTSQRERVFLFELEGSLFWGNAERVAERVEAVPAGTRFVVLDLRRVSDFDESAAMELRQLKHRMGTSGIALLPAGPPSAANEGRPWGEAIAAALGTEPWPSWPDADRAVEHAERQLLAEQTSSSDLVGRPVALSDSGLFLGLDAAQAQRLAAILVPRSLQPGEVLFHEGDRAESLYVLTRGSITVGSAGGTRYVSFSPGTELGELALLDGGGRSADAVADEACEVHALSREALARLTIEDPALAAAIYRRLAAHLAVRLRSASGAWREAAA